MTKTFIILFLFMIPGCGVDPEHDDVTVMDEVITLQPEIIHL